MDKFIRAGVAIFLSLIISCSNSSRKDVPIDKEKMEAYIKSYKDLKQKAPDFLSNVNTGDIEEQKDGFVDFESVLENNGLSYMEFVKINAKVGAIYSILQAENFMDKMEDMQQWGENSIDDGIEQMQEIIDDPDVPEETKEELRKSIAELKASKKNMKKEYNSNKKWADMVLNKTTAITNLFVAEEDILIVKVYFDKITEAYTGFANPTNYIVK